MREEDFNIYAIKNFTKEEIEGTGSTLSSVNVKLFICLQMFRILEARPVVLLPRGLTTGEHKSELHPAGLAADITFHDALEKIDVADIFKNALLAGFKGFGAYHNENAYSFHLDVGESYRFWAGFKKHREQNWHFRALIVDPQSFFTKGE